MLLSRNDWVQSFPLECFRTIVIQVKCIIYYVCARVRARPFFAKWGYTFTPLLKSPLAGRTITDLPILMLTFLNNVHLSAVDYVCPLYPCPFCAWLWLAVWDAVVLMVWWRHQMETFSALLAFCAGNFTGPRWIRRTKPSDAKLWSFLWSVPEQTAEQTIETPMIWDAIVLIMTSLLWIYWVRERAKHNALR